MQTKVAVIMGSSSDWETMKEAVQILKEFGIESKAEIVSAHRSPEKMVEFAKSARSQGYEIIIAGAGGAAHLPGMVASLTTLPVLGVPVQSKSLSGMDSLLSIVQMPGGVPVGTLAIGTAGAKNAGLLAVRILSLKDESLVSKLEAYRDRIREEALSKNKDLI
ncbi:5-(carboxyamino)imidazole ribonucleotide mutase [Leptospira wolffii]|uniref:N5-carboxyaminoimidazole ribonucleotide mutase n=1 Tax=Leptospira wolffii TaxID=409998 RepID=A0ABV5BL03_9LEPT